MASTYSSAKYDFGLKDPVTTDVIGMMLKKRVVTDEHGRKSKAPIWEVYDGKHLVDLFTQSPTQISTNPEEDLPIGQSDWRGGFGLEVQNLDEPLRYHRSLGMDMRFRGRGILGWSTTAVTLPGIPAITDAGLEIWTDSTLTNWPFSTNGTSTLAKEGTTKDSGDWSAKITVSNAVGEYGQILQAATNPTSFQGATITVTARYYNTDVTKAAAKLIIDDGVGAATETIGAVDATWTTVSVTKKIAATAAKVEVICKGYWTSAASTVFFDSINFPEAGVKAIKHAEFDSDLFFANGELLMRMNNSTGVVTVQAGFLNTITDIKKFTVSGTDYLFVFFGTSVTYQYMTTAEAFTTSNATVKTFQFATWVNTTVDTLYANDGTNTVRSTVDPLNAGTAWSDQTIVGDADSSITHLQGKDGALLIDKEDMPYYLDSSGNVQKDLAPECIHSKSTHSGKNSTIWGGEYFRPTGDQELVRIGTINSWISPSNYGTDIGDFAGQVEAVVGDGKYLYCITDNSTDIEVLAGREETIDSSTSWRWHPIHEITLTGCETIFISSIYKKRLYISSTSSGDSLYYFPLPTKYGDIENDNEVSFKNGGTFETSWLHGGFPTEDKLALSATLTMEHSYDANIYFNVYYKLLGGSWSSAVKFDGSGTSMIDTQFLSSAATARTSPMIKLKFEGITDTTAKTPVLLDFKLNTILYPDVKTIYSCVVMCHKALRLKDNATEADNVTVIKAAIANAKAATHPVTITDIDGTEHTVKFLPIGDTPHWLVSSHQASTGSIEREYRLYFMEVPMS